MQLSNERFKSKRFLILKTAAVSVIAASVVAFSHGPMALADSSPSPKLSQTNKIPPTAAPASYQVYVDGVYMGNVSDKGVIDKIIANQAGAMKKAPLDDINFGPQITYIPEETSSVKPNNDETIQSIKRNFQIIAAASAIVIDGKPIVYVANKDKAEQVLKKLKLQYVSEEQLQELEARIDGGNQTLPPLGENQSRILDVQFSKKVSVDKLNAPLSRIMTADKAATYLQKGTLEEKKYKVQSGDTLVSIAHQYNLKLKDLLAINHDLDGKAVLKPGQEVMITSPSPFLEVNVLREENKKESISFSNKVVEDSSLPKGETKVKQKGQNGLRTAIYRITEQSGVVVKKEQTSEHILKQPVDQVVLKGTKVIPSRGDGNFAWPTDGGYVSSPMGRRWGKMHKGIDIARPSDKTIKAADNGRVVFAGWSNGGYGNKVEIDHGNGYRTLYGHMSSIKVKADQIVSKGEAIGIMGETGHATGIHLHFEVRKNGVLKNPLDYLK